MIAIILVSLIALYLVFDFYQRFYKPRLGTKNWATLAKRTGLIYQPPGGAWSNRSSARVMGNYRGYELKLDTPHMIATPVDDGIATYRTRLVLTMNQRVSGSLSLSRRFFLSPRFLGGEGLSSGDEQFDRRFLLKGQPQAFAVGLFANRDLRQRFLTQPKLREFTLSNLGVRLELSGMENDVNRLHDLLNLAADVVQAVKRLEKY
jgi:hypothetical protein